MKSFWQKIISPTSTDPDDARRQRVLNIILVSFFFSISIIWIFYRISFVFDITQILELDPSLQIVMMVTLITLALIYWIGKRWSGALASALLLIMFTIIMMVSDSPDEILGGRSMINLVIPIILASALLPPWTSLVTAGVLIIGHIFLSLAIQDVPNLFAIVTYGVIAVISWLAANQLEQALRGVRKINRELDQRVNERTRELSEALMREQKEHSQSQAILDSIADSVLVMDLDGKLILTNPAFSSLIGKDSTAMIDSKIEELLGENLSSEHVEKVSELLLNEPDKTSTTMQLDWGKKVFSLSSAPVILNNNEQVGIVAVLHDVTHEVEISRMKSSFVAMVSHELRTPLNAIMGLTEMLEQNVFGPLVDKQQDLVSRILANTQRLLYMVKDLLNHAQIEAGTLTIQEIPFSPQELLNGVEESLLEEVKAKNLEWVKDIDPEIPPALIGDPQRLNQVLVNLLTNAIKFTDQGSIRVRFYRSSVDQWTMEVSDTGIGIPESAQQQIFVPFWQVDTSVGRKHSGAGLGLSIVQKLIDLMNGEIHLESKVDQGSTFAVLLPIHTPEN